MYGDRGFFRCEISTSVRYSSNFERNALEVGYCAVRGCHAATSARHRRELVTVDLEAFLSKYRLYCSAQKAELVSRNKRDSVLRFQNCERFIH